MLSIAALRLGDGLIKNPTDFANGMESVLARAMNVLLDKQVEDVPTDDDVVTP